MMLRVQVAMGAIVKVHMFFYYEMCLHDKLQFHRFQSFPNIFAKKHGPGVPTSGV